LSNYMVFDVGGSSVKYAIINGTGDFQIKGDFPSSPYDFEEFQRNIMSVIVTLQEEYTITGIAFSLPGAVDSETGFVGGASALPCIHGPNFKEVFGNATGLPIEIENDANCSALGEVWKGAARENRDVLFTVIGSGIGGAVVKDRKIHKGTNLFGGEFGFMTLNVQEEDGKLRFKTWSDLGSTGSLVRRVAKIKGVNPSELNGRFIFEAAENGDEDCIKEIDKFYLALAQGIFNLQYIFDPEKIILGGAISSREDLIEQINKRMDLIFNSVKIADIHPVIETCQYKNDANLLGALFHYLQSRNEFETSQTSA
jgi:predicted NBD/HSP70 family sugar kinase